MVGTGAALERGDQGNGFQRERKHGSIIGAREVTSDYTKKWNGENSFKDKVETFCKKKKYKQTGAVLFDGSEACGLMKEVLGILGGMGPLASTEFLKTIYELNVTDCEQELPPCILYSDPAFPDRTDAIVNGSGDIFVRLFVEALERLCALGASKLVVSCISSHFFLPQIPTHLRDKVISLIDLAVEEIWMAKRRYLLLCTDGTRKAGIFQRHPRWAQIDRYVVTPGDDDQRKIHSIIYQMKKNIAGDTFIPCFDRLLHNYQVDSFIAGCTEIHLVTKRLMVNGWKNRDCRIVDPLLTLAKNLRSFIKY